MEGGFSMEMYGELFTNCFIHKSKYPNKTLQLSLFGLDTNINQISHFADISLEQDMIKLKDNEIIVNILFRPNFISQLKKIGILKEQIGKCIIRNIPYPIYTINLTKVNQNGYKLEQELVAA